MYPELLHLGPVTVYSYGLMLGIAFFVGNILLTREFKRLGRDPSIATGVTMIALVGGIVGAKLFHLAEHWEEFEASPLTALFSSGGLTWYGGVVVSILILLWYLRRKKMRLLQLADITAPALAICYGIGRIGCHLAGDGCYGIPTDVPWAVTYPNGTVSTLATRNPELVSRFMELFPGRPVPEDIAVHPTPVYEIILAVGLFLFLFLRRKSPHPPGNQFGWFLVLHGVSRFAVEFIRLNPPLVFGLSQAQVLSIVFMAWGVFLLSRPSVQGNPTTGAKSP